MQSHAEVGRVITLKHTKREKGSVTATIPHEIMVSSQPQSPMPLSASSAEMSKRRGVVKVLHICRLSVESG